MEVPVSIILLSAQGLQGAQGFQSTIETIASGERHSLHKDICVPNTPSLSSGPSPVLGSVGDLSLPYCPTPPGAQSSVEMMQRGLG